MRRLLTLTRLIRDRKGAALIEFALAIPVLAIVLLGLVDVASLYSAQLSLEQAAARSLERVQVVNGTAANFAFVQAEAATAANVPTSQVVVENWIECDGVRKPATTTQCTGTEAYARYIGVTIRSTYVPYFRYSPLGVRNAQGRKNIGAFSAVRTA